MTSKERFVIQLRELADFYEQASEELPRPAIPVNVWGITVADIPRIIRDSGRIEKKAVYGVIELRKDLPHHTLIFNISQDKVCERRTVGQRLVPGSAGTPPTAPHYEDQYEWDCKPILSSVPDKPSGFQAAPDVLQRSEEDPHEE